MFKIVQEGSEANETGASMLDEIVRDGARQMLAAALQAEVAAYVEAHRGEVDADGRRLVVRNGFHAAREVTTAAGAVPVRQPRVNDKRIDEVSGERKRFSSAILPAWSRKSPRVAEVLPLLYLHGLSSSDFGPALEQFLGSDQGLSAATITRLTAQWQDDARAFNARSLAGTDYVYVWVDGIHLKVRLEADKVCLLVVIGVRADGRKELITLADGFRESAESWADLLRDAKRRGMIAPVLAVGDGALGSGKPSGTCSPKLVSNAVGGTRSATSLPRCRSRPSRPRNGLWRRSTTPRNKTHARAAAKAFAAQFGAKWPKAAAKITDDLDVLLAFYDYPAEHWIHLRTTNPISVNRLRQQRLAVAA
jgi:transposase-like protein